MKAKLQSPRKLQGQEQTFPSSPNSMSSMSSIRVNKKTNYSSRPRASSSLRKSARVESMLQDSRCIILRNQLESSLEDENRNSNKLDFSQIETNQLNRLISHLREYTQYCAVEGNYAEARRSEYIGSRAKSVLEKRTTKIKPTNKIVEDQKESKSNFEQRWHNKFIEYENETNEKRDKLQKKQAHETRVFERIWAQEMPQKYRKPSQRLLQLMQIEKSLAISGEIDHADYIHSQVVKQTQIEMENAQSNLIHDYQTAKAKHLEKQYIEMNRFEQLRNHGKDLLDADYRADMLRVSHRDHVVQMHVRESILKAKKDQTPPTRSAGVPKNRDSTITSLLPRLIAPNDPSIIRNEKIRRKQIYGKQQEFQRRTIETLQAESCSNKRQNQIENNKTDLNEKESLTDDLTSTQKVERKRKRKRKINSLSQELINNPNEEYAEYEYYYYSEDENKVHLEADNKIIISQDPNQDLLVNPLYNSPMSSEIGNNIKNGLFESSDTLFSDTNPKVRFQSEDENKYSVVDTLNSVLDKINENSLRKDSDTNENNHQNQTSCDKDDKSAQKVENNEQNQNENIENNQSTENDESIENNQSNVIDESNKCNENDENDQSNENKEAKESDTDINDNTSNIDSSNDGNAQKLMSTIANNLMDNDNQKD